MNRLRATGLAQSVQTRLKNKAKNTNRPFSELLELFAIERFLHRLGSSLERDRFVLKGAQLLRHWLGADSRPTRDVDLLGPKDLEPRRLQEKLSGILSAEVEDDGIEFEAENLGIRPIRIGSAVLGLRAKTLAYIGRTRIPCQIDVGLGDSVYPEPESLSVRGVLDFEVARVRAYTPYTSVAEKLEAIIVLGMANTRMKDYYDLRALPSALSFDGPTLVEAVRRTFDRRATPVPTEKPEGLTSRFGSGRTQSVQWRAFLRKSRLTDAPTDFEEVVKEIAVFLLPVLEAARSRSESPGNWPAGGPWDSSPGS